MGLVNPTIPEAGTGSVPAQAQIDCLDDFVTEINGGLDHDNLKTNSIGPEKWPDSKWKVYTATLEAKLVGGPVIPSLPDYLYGTQVLLSNPLPTGPLTPSLRQVGVEFTYTKGEQFGGGNDAANELILYYGNPFQFFYTKVAGSTGVVTNETAFFNPGESVAAAGSATSTGPNGIINSSRGFISAYATGANGPLSGVFTIHDITIRYRDLEFS